jgi:hypothetical protein
LQAFSVLLLLEVSVSNLEKPIKVKGLHEIGFRSIPQDPVLTSEVAGFVAILLTRSVRSPREIVYKLTN